MTDMPRSDEEDEFFRQAATQVGGTNSTPGTALTRVHDTAEALERLTADETEKLQTTAADVGTDVVKILADAPVVGPIAKAIRFVGYFTSKERFARRQSELTSVFLAEDVAASTRGVEGLGVDLASLEGRVTDVEETLSDEWTVGPLNAAIDQARDLMRIGQATASKTLLQALLANSGANLSNIENFRARANLGLGLLQLGEPKNAASLFLDAAGFLPGHQHALAFKSLGHLLRGERAESETAARLSLEANPSNALAASTLIRILSQKGAPFADLLAEVESHVREKADVAIALAQAAHQQEDNRAAERWAQTALRDAPDQAEAFDILGVAQVARALSSLDVQDGVPFVDDVDLLRRGLRSLESAVDLMPSHAKEQLALLHLNIATVKRILGEPSDAAFHLRAAKECAPTDQAVIFQWSRAEIENGRGKDVVERLKKTLSIEPSAFGELLLAKAKAQSGVSASEIVAGVMGIIDSDEADQMMRREAALVAVQAMEAESPCSALTFVADCKERLGAAFVAAVIADIAAQNEDDSARDLEHIPKPPDGSLRSPSAGFLTCSSLILPERGEGPLSPTRARPDVGPPFPLAALRLRERHHARSRNTNVRMPLYDVACRRFWDAL